MWGWGAGLKEFAHSVMKSRKFKICSSGSKPICWQNSLLLVGSHFFVLFRPSTDWMKPTCIMEDNLLYSKSTDLHNDIPYMWNIKRNDTNELICKTETDSQP